MAGTSASSTTNDPALAAAASATTAVSWSVKNAITRPGNAAVNSLRVVLHWRSPSWTSARNATFGLKSKQFFVQPRHGRQCELGTLANGVWPYIRWTGSIGHSDEHQPLLPLSRKPPANAATSAPPISAAVAAPLSSNTAGRARTLARKSAMPTSGA